MDRALEVPATPAGSAPAATVLRYDPGTAEALERLATGALPEGLRARAPRAEAFRDVHWDTEQGDLEARGAWVRVRHPDQGPRTLTVCTGPAAEGGRTAAEPLSSDEGPALWTGDAAALLRALADPARLVPRVEMEVHRRVRDVSAPDGARGTLVCDAVVARDGDLRAPFGEVALAQPEGEETDVLPGMLRRAAGLPRVTEPRLARARAALRLAELDLLERAVRRARRVAVVALEGGRIALRRTRDGLRVPAGGGAGEDAARQVLRDCFGTDGARVRLLGHAPGAADRAAVEVWLAEGLPPAGEEPAGVEMVRIPVDEVLHSVGSPALRERDTLAALHVVARSAVAVDAEAGEEDERARAALAGVPSTERRAAGRPAPGTLLNMELSILAFNRRVLGLAEDARIPLLERVRFLSIFGANTDEFFRVRVAGFKRQVALGSTKRTIDGVTPQEQLDAIGVRARRLLDRAYALLTETLLPTLAVRGIHVVVSPAELSEAERAYVRGYYDREVHPRVMPLTAGPGHPFPHIRNLRPALATRVRDPDTGERRLGIVELPDGLPRFVRLPDTRRFVPLEEVIRSRLPELYPSMEVDEPHTFRVTRSAELHLAQKQVEDLLHAVEEQVRKRRFRPVVRLEVESAMPSETRAMLLRELQYEAPGRVSALGREDVYQVERLMDLGGLGELADLDEDALHYPPAAPARRPLPEDAPVFQALRGSECLVSFPEDSFRHTVERLVVEAAEDPDVIAIKLALYRTNPRSRIVEALRRASARGKQVVALVELTARFDELSNIHWARYLRSYGIHVIYGVPGLKVHAKIALIVRREGDGVRRYLYIGTGNLNARTAELYTDLGLLSASPALGEDLNTLFNTLTAGAGAAEYHHLLVAPYNMRDRFVAMIEREAEHARAGRGGHVRAKFNGLADREIITALYRASQDGARIELLVRGICALRPGVSGLSDNIRVYSLLGRYLEHARIFRFGNAGDPEYFIGSADWRTRNLSRRVEVAVPIRDPDHRARLDAVLEDNLSRDDLWELGADGTYYQRPAEAPREPPPAADDEAADRRRIITPG